jgi:hypothetical protein
MMKRSLAAILGMAAAAVVVLTGANVARAAEAGHSEFYGYVMMDAGYNNKAINPDWWDVQRPSKLPSYENEFGKDGSTFMGVRQTRFGVKSWLPTDMGELKTTFEFEMFGTGANAGQTTFRLRHAYGELGKWGAGQTWSPFMDIDVFPNTLEYWGPNGMVFFRNVQLRYMPIQGDTRMTLALEAPGASGDQSVYAEKIDFSGVTARFPLPDLSAEYRIGKPWGYVEAAGIVRDIEWQDLNASDTQDLSDNALGWGINLSSNLKAGKSDVLRLQFVYGEGIENYMNDAPADIGTETNPGHPMAPVKGVALPVTGIVAFLDHSWNEKTTSSVGYSSCSIDNSEGQAPDAFKLGQYVLANILFTPMPKFMCGIEGGWIHRENNSDGWKIDDYHVQISAKYAFSFNTGGN